MQMSAQAIRQLQELIDSNNWRHAKGDKGVSFATLDDRAQALFLCFRQLHANLNIPVEPKNLKTRHVRKLVHFWEGQGLSASTLQKRFSYLKTFSRWIGKAGMLEGSIWDYLKHPETGRRTYVAQLDKSWSSHGIDADALIERISAFDTYVGAQLRLQREFGLRAKEAYMCRPHEADLKTMFAAIDYLEMSRGTKGGRIRYVPIDSPRKRAALEHAKQLVQHPSHHMGRPGKSLKQNKRRYYFVLEKFGITRKHLQVTGHGLRTEYANNGYQNETGHPPPVRGGSEINRETDRKARLKVASELGHGRENITSAYLGGIFKKLPRGRAQPA
jgi:site-specific recombinase XerC